MLYLVPGLDEIDLKGRLLEGAAGGLSSGLRPKRRRLGDGAGQAGQCDTEMYGLYDHDV